MKTKIDDIINSFMYNLKDLDKYKPIVFEYIADSEDEGYELERYLNESGYNLTYDLDYSYATLDYFNELETMNKVLDLANPFDEYLTYTFMFFTYIDVTRTNDQVVTYTVMLEDYEIRAWLEDFLTQSPIPIEILLDIFEVLEELFHSFYIDIKYKALAVVEEAPFPMKRVN